MHNRERPTLMYLIDQLQGGWKKSENFQNFFETKPREGVNMSKIVYLGELCINQLLKHFIYLYFSFI